jgi:hypothetical protein
MTTAEEFDRRLREAVDSTPSRSAANSGGARITPPPERVKNRVEFEHPTWFTTALAKLQRIDRLPHAAPCSDPWIVNGVQSLAAKGRTMVQCCERHEAEPHYDATHPKVESFITEFENGGYMSCAYYIATVKGWDRAGTQAELSAIVGPVASESEALGRVALMDNSVLAGSGPYGHRRKDATSLRISAPSVSRRSTGFEVVTPFGEDFGCEPNTIVGLRTFQVSQGGAVTRSANKVLICNEPSCPD